MKSSQLGRENINLKVILLPQSNSTMLIEHATYKIKSKARGVKCIIKLRVVSICVSSLLRVCVLVLTCGNLFKLSINSNI